jgi:hypothetical protein
LPREAGEAIEVLVLLAGNLARDQVRELERAAAATRTAKDTSASTATTTNNNATAATTTAATTTPVTAAGKAERFAGRLALYATIGSGASLERDSKYILPATLGLALRWRPLTLGVEGLAGMWSAGYVGADLVVMGQHAFGKVLLAAGAAGGVGWVGGAPPDAGGGYLVRGIFRATMQVSRRFDAFAQVEYAFIGKYSGGWAQGIALDLGAQVRFLQ